MKRLLSISLILVFLFQFIGYYFVNIGLRYQARTEISQRLESERYSDSETVTFKIPFIMPYGTGSKGYMAAEGEFEYKGEFYKMVKQKLESDTLYLVCLNNHTEKELVANMANFIKLSTDLPTSSQQSSKASVNLIKDYVSQSPVEMVSQQGWSINQFFVSENSNSLPQTDFSILSPPPRVSC